MDGAPPRHSLSLKLRCRETDGSIMMFEGSAPVEAKSTLHLHRDSDEVAYVMRGELTCLIGDDVTVCGAGSTIFMPRGVRHAWKSTGTETGHVLFLYTPAKAGGLIEEQEETGRGFGSMSQIELADLLRRHGWELFGASPL